MTTTVIKVCPRCLSACAGGLVCEDCGTRLRDPWGEGARRLPPEVWRTIRFQYGARRGMLVRVLAWLAGPAVALVLVREASGAATPLGLAAGVCAAIAAGVSVWAMLFFLATPAVRLWVAPPLRRDRLLRAAFRRLRRG